MTTFLSRFAVLVCVSSVAAALLAAATARPAHACGGFFCDRPPPDGALPIAQAGENVLFVLDKGQVEAHIQILYKGDAAQFSWVVPVTAPPTLDVGSDALFDRVELATRPAFRAVFQMEGTCIGFGSGGGVGCGGLSAPKANGSAAGGGAPVDDLASHVVVVFRGNVGPFDSAVIRSDDPAALKAWLTTNGYFVSDASASIIDEYVAAHSSFVALRLQPGKDTSAIQPIVLRLPSDEGCLPLKLTAIASNPDLRINVWVLGDARAVPLDFVEIGINQAKLDWFNAGSNYDKLLGEAANEAGGDAFAVEYAKPSAAVAQQLIVSRNQIDQLARITDPSTYLNQLKTMGFYATGAVLTVLRQDFPVPADLAAAGVTDAQYYGQGYQITNFDAAKLTADLDVAVFTPLAKAQPLFASHAFLTRLATFISPEEMTKDPRFVTNAELPAVEPQHVAVAHMLCGDQDFDVCHAPVRLHLESGDDVNYAVVASAPKDCNSSQTPIYDRTTVDTLPSSDVGWLRDSVGEGHMVVDNRAAISAGLAKHNASVQLSAGGCGCSVLMKGKGGLGRGRPVVAALVLVSLLIARRRPRQRQQRRRAPATKNPSS